MSSFKNFAPMLSSLQDQADGKGTIAGSALEDFLSIAGYETPGGSGGGGDAAIIIPLTDTGTSFESPTGSGDYSFLDLVTAFAGGKVIRLVLENSDRDYVIATEVIGYNLTDLNLYAAWGAELVNFSPVNDAFDPGIMYYYD